jgi:peptidyl-dipeptidase Dcp
MSKKSFIPFLVVASMFIGCDGEKQVSLSNNPFLGEYNTPFNVPPFDKIKDEHYRPAFEEALHQHNAEIDSIVNNTEAPTFENTIVALENAGSLLSKVSRVFFNMNSANTNDTIQAIAKDLAPVLSAHSDEIRLNNTLFERVKAIYDQKES